MENKYFWLLFSSPCLNSLDIASKTEEPSNNLKWNVKNNLLSPLNISSWKENYLGNAIRCELFLLRSIAVLSIITAEWERRKPVDAACICTKRRKAHVFRNHSKRETTRYLRALLITPNSYNASGRKTENY